MKNKTYLVVERATLFYPQNECLQTLVNTNLSELKWILTCDLARFCGGQDKNFVVAEFSLECKAVFKVKAPTFLELGCHS